MVDVVDRVVLEPVGQQQRFREWVEIPAADHVEEDVRLFRCELLAQLRRQLAADFDGLAEGGHDRACGLLDAAQRPHWRRARRFLRRLEQAADGFTCFFCARRSRL